MILPRICNRVLQLSKMIRQHNHSYFSPFSSIYCEKLYILQTPRFIPFKFQSFCCSRLTHQPKVLITESIQTPTSLNASRFSRLAKTEAQDALFDYLHSTRNFSFTDAEHISKNSPNFLQNLVSKIDTSKDVTRSLTRFLRYNPINEFEPFFESLGLCPSELSLLLPRHLMFLSDDHLLLENFHVLCDYGIPRSTIGNMYKEAREIFGYEYGVLVSKLRAYENLNLSRNTVIKLVTHCPSLLIGGVDDKLIKVLEKLKDLGFRNDWVGGYLAVGTSSWNRVHDTMDFLEKVGYKKDQLCNLLKTNPTLVFQGSGRKVYVLFGHLLKLGLRMDDVYDLFIKNPQIMSGKRAKNLLQAVGFLVEIGMEVIDIANMITAYVEQMGLYSLKGPRTVCRDLKVGKDGLCRIIMDEPSKLFDLASKTKVKSKKQIDRQDPSKHLEKTVFLMRMGYVEHSEEMTKAVKRFRGRGDQLQERFDCLVNAGLDYNVAKEIVKHAPTVLNQSKDVIERKIDCLKNFLGYPLESVVVFPSYLCYDIERINHRFKMYAWLRERGVAKPSLSLSTILACSEARFIKYFVDVHPEGLAVWERLKSSPKSS